MEKYDEIVLTWKNQKLRSAAELEAALNGYMITTRGRFSIMTA